jgi:LPPG:FO 2-phospho-L-lactate transferase
MSSLENLKVVALVGGVGGAKLAHGLAQILPPHNLTVIVNTGDDFWHYGLRICPDLDTVMYTLGGLVDKGNGWGVAGDTVNLLDALKRYGQETWFRLGDQDVATHLLRTQWLHDGQTLTQITRQLTTRLGILHAILPMTDASVATKVDTVEHGEIDFQEYFVRLRWQPVVKGLRLEGIETAQMTPEVTQAVADADIIVFGPSNPWLSLMPILSVPGMRVALLARDVPRVAITPIVQGAALKGPASKMMAELGYRPSASAVVDYYGDVINGFVYDERDVHLAQESPLSHTTTFDTIMRSDADRALLARKVLDWIEEWRHHERLGDYSG